VHGLQVGGLRLDMDLRKNPQGRC